MKIQKETDVLFIVPPFFRFIEQRSEAFHLGFGYLAATLKQNGITSLIYNSDYSALPNEITNVSKLENRLRKLLGKKFHKNFIQPLLKSLPEKKKKDVYEERSMHHQRIHDESNIVWKDVQKALELTKPKIVGISAKMVDITAVFVLTKLIKQTIPNVKIIVGGAAASTCYEKITDDLNVDYLILNEGEITIVELSKCILANEDNPENLKEIKGIIYRDNGEIKKTKPRELISNLDDIPLPDRESTFYLNADGSPVQLIQGMDILTSRGCPYKCKFCACHAVWNTKKPRMRSNENIMQELKLLYEKYNQKHFIFWDDLFTIDRKKVIDLCERIKANNLEITWLCLLRLNTIDEELLEIMKSAGCVEVQVGIESGNDRVLKHIGKSITVQVIKEKIEVINKSGLKWLGFFILGFPTETKEEMLDTIDFVKTINPSNVNYAIFSPYPGSVFYDELKNDNKLSKDFIEDDLLNINSTNYTGTMNDDEFRKIAIEALHMNRYE